MLGSVSDLSAYNGVEVSVPSNLISYTDKSIVKVAYKAIRCKLVKIEIG